MDLPVVTAEVADGAITPIYMAYVVDQLQRTCGEDAGRVRRAQARLFGPDHSGVSFAEATLMLTDGSTLSESGPGTMTWRLGARANTLVRGRPPRPPAGAPR